MYGMSGVSVILQIRKCAGRCCGEHIYNMYKCTGLGVFECTFVSSEDPDPSLLHSGGDLVLHSPTGLARRCRNPNLHTMPGSGGDIETQFLYDLYKPSASCISSFLLSTVMFH